MKERLQKLIAAAGVASRRKAEELIALGAVTVNGEVIVEPGAKADPDHDHIKVNGKLLNPQLARNEKVYVLLNKPIGYLTSTADPHGRPLVIDLIGKYRQKVHPVGRLDFNTEGLLLLTNDGAFTQLVTRAASHVPKRYEVKVKGQPSEVQINRLRQGTAIDGVRTAPAKLRSLRESATNTWFEVILFEGRNQQIRKMFDEIGHSVIKLRRVAIGFLNHEKLALGEFRLLQPAEIERFFKLGSSKAKAAVKGRTTRTRSGRGK
jgi:23S rRNA pseudouridine2605 synthase